MEEYECRITRYIFLNLEDKNVSISSDGIIWLKIAEMKLVDESTTGLNIEKSFVSGSDIIFYIN